MSLLSCCHSRSVAFQAGAIEGNPYQLTSMGRYIVSLPLDIHLAKMVVYGALFSCLDPILTIAAAMAVRTPFMSPFEKRAEADKARRRFAHGDSDYLTLLKVSLLFFWFFWFFFWLIFTLNQKENDNNNNNNNNNNHDMNKIGI